MEPQTNQNESHCYKHAERPILSKGSTRLKTGEAAFTTCIVYVLSTSYPNVYVSAEKGAQTFKAVICIDIMHNAERNRNDNDNA